MAYVTKADIESLLGAFTVPAHWTDDADAYLNLAIARAKATIDGFTGNTFEAANRMVLLSGNGDDYLPLSLVTSWSLLSIVDIYYRADYEDDFDDSELVDATYYTLANSGKTVRRVAGIWVTGIKNYRLRGTFGSASVPPVIRKAATLLVREEVEPGYIDQAFGQNQSEHHPDGFSYVRDKVSGSAPIKATGRTTGYGYIDRLLIPFANTLPLMTWK